MPQTFTLETFRRIYDDEEGVYPQVGPDGDSLGLVELRVPDAESQKFYGDIRIAFHPDQARRLAEALIAAADDQQKSKE